MAPLLRSLSLRTRILVTTVGTVLLLGAGATLFVRRALERTLLEQLGNRGLATARHLAASAVDPVLTEQFVALDLMFRESRQNEPDIAYVFALSPRGEVLAHTFSGGFPTALKSANGGGPAARALATDGGVVLDVAVPLLNGDLGVLRLGMSESSVRGEVRRAVRAILWIVVACTLAAAALATVLGLAIAEPLVRLAGAADEVGAGRFPDAVAADSGGEIGRLTTAFNAMVAGRRAAEAEQARLIDELREALANVRQLQGMLPICASCKRIRDDRGYWSQIESYLSQHADIRFSHGLCPACVREHYPEYAEQVEARLAEGAQPAAGQPPDPGPAPARS